MSLRTVKDLISTTSDEWYELLAPVTLMSYQPQEVYQQIRTLTEQFFNLLHAPNYSAGDGEALGAALAAHKFVQFDVIGKSTCRT